MFENIDIGIRTFLRDDQLFNALSGLSKNFSNARLVIVDDGDHTEEKEGVYADLTRAGHITESLPFDSGFGRKSNKIVELSTRPYLLIASDDFEFDEQAATGLAALESTLDYVPEVDIASGRVNNRPYEFWLEDLGDTVIEHRIDENDSDDIRFIECDLTINYSLFRRHVFEKIRWEDDVKIGGAEHGAQAIKIKRAGFKTVFVPKANISEQGLESSQRYKTFRARANNVERPCFDRIGVKKYVLGNGQVDYRK